MMIKNKSRKVEINRMNTEDQPFIILLEDDSNNVEALAGVLDNEDKWVEKEDLHFYNLTFPEITLDIVTEENKTKYIYSMKSDSQLKFQLLNSNNGKELSDKIEIKDLIDTLSNSDDVKTISKNSVSTEIEVNILGKILIIREIVLISIGRKKSILQFIY